MHTIQDQPSEGSPRRRRFHSDEFKAVAVAAAAQPGVSLAAVAMAHGINANLLRRWVRDAEAIRDPALDRHSKALPAADSAPSPLRKGKPLDDFRDWMFDLSVITDQSYQQ